jgi:hypothetical protein
MPNDKVQRSFYLSEDQARWLKVRAAETNKSASSLIAELIDSARGGQSTTPEQVESQMKNVHNVLSKIAKQ